MQAGPQGEPSRRLVAINITAQDDHAPRMVATLNNLGNAYGQLGNPSKQRDLLKRALAIFERACGRDHVDLAATLGNLALTYGKLGETCEGAGHAGARACDL